MAIGKLLHFYVFSVSFSFLLMECQPLVFYYSHEGCVKQVCYRPKFQTVTMNQSLSNLTGARTESSPSGCWSNGSDCTVTSAVSSCFPLSPQSHMGNSRSRGSRSEIFLQKREDSARNAS
ncbi:hypothetical protein I7I48_08696 [Histoplasma ohiense]|nr:hypothetical protein I7I48_08696 [Histoplasma ohiense (nom. inval.)]